MRRLNRKNKVIMGVLISLVAIVVIIVIVFIVYKIKDYNVKYDVKNGNIAFNSSEELLKIDEDTYVKKDLLGRYYVLLDSSKVFLGENGILFNPQIGQVTYYGTFHEILDNGEVTKYKGETLISGTSVNRIFKIDDRKYLIVGNDIHSEDNTLKAKYFLLINIDKVGNAYVYNNDINYKSFGSLSIKNDDFTFNVNEEKLTIGSEEIDLSKIKGSTNEYEAKKKEILEEQEKEPSDSQGGGDGTGGNIYAPDPIINVITEIINETMYVARKTTVVDIKTTASEATVTYLIHDPYTEFTNLYVEIYKDTTLVKTEKLEINATSYVIKSLDANETYSLKFYYSYNDEAGANQNTLFDSAVIKTKNITGNIALDKVSNNSVRYILKVDKKYILDSAKVALYVDDILIDSQDINVREASTDSGFIGLFEGNLTGNTVKLVLENCIYNGHQIDIDASYKYII